MRILYATDGSEGARSAGELLASLPLPPETKVTVLTVAGGGDGRAIAEAGVELLRGSGVRVEAQVRSGGAADEILKVAAELQAGLVVIGGRGHTALTRFFLGSVADRVARHAHCPVLMVRPHAGRLREVVLGVDGSDSAARAADWLLEFPLPPECEIRLATLLPNLETITRTHFMVPRPLVDDPTTLDQQLRQEARARLDALCARFRAAGKSAATEIRSGDPAEGLLQVAQDEGADLVVIGSHVHTAVHRFLMGGTSENVLRHAGCSVLVVR